MFTNVNPSNKNRPELPSGKGEHLLNCRTYTAFAIIPVAEKLRNALRNSKGNLTML